jgi:eukaryotic-like serine/threonine-protein kinase
VTPGTRIGSFEVLSKLGEGGMGEVFRARDTTLDRDVAIKILPDVFAADPERLARFDREAKTLAALNHPHIAQIYGVETAPGSGARALVMELVEGPTLADMLATSPHGLPLEDALAIGRQIADALETAHELGIVHRDLKPANIKVRPDGVVKVLDFGLAKLLDGPAEAGHYVRGLTASPTITSPAMTHAGVILGTAAYMAPEQAAGKATDRRADIFSFGAVLYEMLSGRRAFDGDSVSETLASVLKTDPDWRALPPATPPALRALVERCLVKDRRQRLQAIGEARIVLERPAAQEEPRAQKSAGASWGWAVAAVMAVVAATSLWWSFRSKPLELRRVVRLSTSMAVASVPGALAFSPDGVYLAFVEAAAPRQIRIRRLDDLTSSPLAGTEGAAHLGFSPDGKSIAFVSNDAVRKVSIVGGAAERLAEARSVIGPPTLHWASDDTIYFADEGQLKRVSSAGGAVTAITEKSDQKKSFFSMSQQMLPGGDELLTSEFGTDGGQVVAVNLRDFSRKVVLKSASAAQFVPAGSRPTLGYLIYFVSATGSVMAVPFDASRLETLGVPVQVLNGVSGFSSSPFGLFAISPSGSLAYVPAVAGQGGVSMAWIDPKGVEESLKTPAPNLAGAKVSPTDPNRIAMTVYGDRGTDVWVYDVARGTQDRITNDGFSQGPIWTRDGTRLLYERTPASKRPAVMWAPADRSGPPSELVLADTAVVPYSVSPDGAWVFGHYAAPVGKGGLWMVPLRTQPASFRTILDSPFRTASPDISPDGRWLAYVSEETGRRQVYVTAFPGPGPRITISTNAGQLPRWSHNGRELFYRGGGGAQPIQLMAVDVTPGPTFKAERPRVISDQLFQSFEPAADGRFLVVKPATARSADGQVVIVLNWLDELRRRVPLRE